MPQFRVPVNKGSNAKVPRCPLNNKGAAFFPV